MSDERKTKAETKTYRKPSELSDEQLDGASGGIANMATAKLEQFAINGNSCGPAEIDFVEVAGGGDEAKDAPSKVSGNRRTSP